MGGTMTRNDIIKAELTRLGLSKGIEFNDTDYTLVSIPTPDVGIVPIIKKKAPIVEEPVTYETFYKLKKLGYDIYDLRTQNVPLMESILTFKLQECEAILNQSIDKDKDTDDLISGMANKAIASESAVSFGKHGMQINKDFFDKNTNTPDMINAANQITSRNRKDDANNMKNFNNGGNRMKAMMSAIANNERVDKKGYNTKGTYHHEDVQIANIHLNKEQRELSRIGLGALIKLDETQVAELQKREDAIFATVSGPQRKDTAVERTMRNSKGAVHDRYQNQIGTFHESKKELPEDIEEKVSIMSMFQR